MHHIIENRDGKRFRTDTTIRLSVEKHADIHKEYYDKWGFHSDYVAWKGLSEQIGKDEIFFETSRIGGLNNRGKVKSKEHRKNLGDALRGRTYEEMNLEYSQERKKKISEAMKGNKSSKNHSSSEYKKVQSEAMKKAWAKRKAKVTNRM